MAISLHELLQPQVILQVVSRISGDQRNRLSRWLGWQPLKFDKATVSLRGPNSVEGDTRYATFRIFDHTRVVPKSRAPGTGPSTVAPNPTGDVPVACARFHEKIPLSYEELGNLSPIVGPNANIDTGGQDYLTRQTGFLAEQFNNGMELMATGMMQDNLWFTQQGDNWLPVIGNPATPNVPSFQVSFQIPAGNKNQLNMLGTGNIITVPWSNPGALIFNTLSQIKAAFAQLTGYPLTDIWVNSLVWYMAVTNTEIRNLAGTAATPYAEYNWVEERGLDGGPTGEYYAVLKADPTVNWHISDHVLVTNSDVDPSYGTAPASATLIKVVPDNTAFFCTRPSGMWQKIYYGGEYIVENPGMPAMLRRGYYFWKEYVTQPSAIDLIGLLNAIPLLFVPKIIAPATVSGF
jgi:hypothetical protein